MPLSAAISLTAHLNACRHSALSAEVAAHAVTGDHAAHHVIDGHGLLGLDPFSASELEAAMGAALLLFDCDWLLVTPRPGRLAPLTGPVELTTLALEVGAAVIAQSGGVAWVPQPVGPAIQWTILPANRPGAVGDASEADRHLRESVVQAGRTLADLPLGTAERPEIAPPPVLPPVYGRRAQQTVARAWQLVHALEVALTDDGITLHTLGAGARRQALSALRDAADNALVTAVSWTGVERR
ncbi:hypothetical protein [Granulicoccus sp. GXG6511]|uniref:hypothetical protein n=1 Tax=Granulicoccus sp. GXG6511 TaxID=3381351 RepID=UPI003D7D7981